jgi:hypothetical protein
VRYAPYADDYSIFDVINQIHNFILTWQDDEYNTLRNDLEKMHGGWSHEQQMEKMQYEAVRDVRSIVEELPKVLQGFSRMESKEARLKAEASFADGLYSAMNRSSAVTI